MSDPVRLRDPRSNATKELRELVAAGRSEMPDAERLSVVAGRLGLLSSTTPGRPDALLTHGAQGMGAAGAIKLGGIAVLVLGVGTAIVAARGRSFQAPPATLTPGATMTVASPPEPTHWVEVLPPRQEATQAAPAATVPSHGGHRGGTRAVASAAAVSVSMSAPPTALVPRSDSAPSTWGSSLALVPSPPDEERSPAAEGLVRQAQRELPSNPARALDLALRDEGISGGLVEERDVVIIRALVRLGRAEEARERAARFLRVYPRSEHRGEIAALFGFDPGRQNL